MNIITITCWEIVLLEYCAKKKKKIVERTTVILLYILLWLFCVYAHYSKSLFMCIRFCHKKIYVCNIKRLPTVISAHMKQDNITHQHF